jgi:DNA-directed RNA polymerase subunit M/transcription elongation factor TFIIS
MSSTVARLRKAAASTAGSTTASVQVLLLTQKAEVKAAKLTTAPDGTITLAMIQALLKKKEAPEFLGSYKYKSQGLFLFGYLNGKAGQENKHELPPPHETILPFGDIVLLASKDTKSWKHPVPFTSDEYEAFYTKAFGGFEELDDEDEEDEEDDVEEEEDVAAVEEDVDVVDEGGDESESDEEECEEEDEEGDVEGEAEGAGEDCEEVVAPVAARTPVRAKKAKRANPSSAAGAAQIYTTYLYVPAEEELRTESFSSNDYAAQSSSPRRMKNLGILIRLFKGYLTDAECRQFERCIYVASLRMASQRHVGKTWSHPPFVEIYETVAKHLAANFYPNSYVGNIELFDRYKKGQTTFEEISQMDTYQLFEGRWHDSFEAQKVREKRQLEGNKAMATDRFICSRCHKRECTYYEMQTRSADEPMTIFITCLNCGKHWRQ